MGLLRRLALLPITGPLDASLWVAAKLTEQIDAERNNPAELQTALARAEQQLLAGELTEDQYDQIEDDLLLRLRTATVR